MIKNSLIKPLMGVATIAALSVGCSSVPDKAVLLKDAQAAYNAAQANTVTASASLYDAEQALKKAESAQDTEEMRHLAYIAQRKAELAVALGERKAADVERENLTKQKSSVLLTSREREANQARLEAERRAREAELALGKLQAEQAKNKALQEQLTELEGKQTDRGLVLTLGDVLFETGKAELLSGALAQLDKLAVFLNQNPRNVLVEGHTDSRGSAEFNMNLSQQRAESVRNALVTRGIASTRILARGFGESRPLASNTTQTGRQQNRRVELTILNDGEVLR